jgi:hypothetical protein
MTIALRTLAILVLLLMGAIIALQLSCPSWPSVRGKVIHGGWASQNRVDSFVEYGVYEVRYEYELGGTRYENQRIGFDTNRSVMPILSDSEQVVRQPRELDEVNVYYCPQYPALSVLITEVSPRIWIWGILSLLAAGGLYAWSRIVAHPLY